jgi:hypothetical protein
MAPTWVKHKGREPFAPIARSASYLEVVGVARPHGQHSCKNDGGVVMSGGTSGITRGDDVDEKVCVAGPSVVNNAADNDSDSAHESVDVSTTTEGDDGEPDVASVRSSLMAIGLFIVHDVSESCRVLQRAPTSSYPPQCFFTAPLTCSASVRAPCSRPQCPHCRSYFLFFYPALAHTVPLHYVSSLHHRRALQACVRHSRATVLFGQHLRIITERVQSLIARVQQSFF